LKQQKLDDNFKKIEDKTNYSSYAHPTALSYILKTGLKVEARY